ncbi:hypothetical protein TRSC58_07445 [Trypanosoma rangeli SC58]|uniref:Secreted protein n=1 Tax=Trypanosoma rangeli SC58 TaxID=429131 RepID=A0A061IVA0_TRYRA|nr:hypothetical protein TRSC58_07445 [Trypanosoma rangeli SC58]
MRPHVFLPFFYHSRSLAVSLCSVCVQAGVTYTRPTGAWQLMHHVASVQNEGSGGGLKVFAYTHKTKNNNTAYIYIPHRN